VFKLCDKLKKNEVGFFQTALGMQETLGKDDLRLTKNSVFGHSVEMIIEVGIIIMIRLLVACFCS
jgi:hypothetical protein